MFDYRQISSDLINELPDRTKSVVSRRFGLDRGTEGGFGSFRDGKIKRESLESIGIDYGITRERVRQIERDGISRMRNSIGKYKPVFKKFEEKMMDFGGLKKEDLYISSLAEEGMANHVFLLLEISESFFRFSENKDFHSFWAMDTSHFDYAKDTVGSIKNILNEKNQPLTVDHCANMISSAPIPRINSYLEISKHIHLNDDGFFGLKNWPEVNPKGIKDKAYMALKKNGKPLHFTETAAMIGDSVLPQTVHNELIKDSRFVLVGRGIYALQEWGYEPGEIKEVIKKIMLETGKPLDKKEIIRKVMEKRIVKENTILQNLSNKKYFKRDSEGKYIANA